MRWNGGWLMIGVLVLAWAGCGACQPRDKAIVDRHQQALNEED